jgi:ParB/RepB/Spo0J family partition protein
MGTKVGAKRAPGAPRDRTSPRSSRRGPRVENISVGRIRPEEGLGRQRDRDGHRDLCRSIDRFGVLTPITVRRAGDGSGEYLLIKGQGRTLACRILGLDTIPAIVLDEATAEAEKVQQFLVENVARLRMRPIDRALLIAHAREEGEETTEVARRFGVSYSTVRRLEAQLEGATSGEVKALRESNVTLSLHSVIARHVLTDERIDVIRILGPTGIRASELEALFTALGWRHLSALGPEHQNQRLALLSWASTKLSATLRGNLKDRLRRLALDFPAELPAAPDEAMTI